MQDFALKKSPSNGVCIQLLQTYRHIPAGFNSTLFYFFRFSGTKVKTEVRTTLFCYPLDLYLRGCLY